MSRIAANNYIPYAFLSFNNNSIHIIDQQLNIVRELGTDFNCLKKDENGIVTKTCAGPIMDIDPNGNLNVIESLLHRVIRFENLALSTVAIEAETEGPCEVFLDENQVQDLAGNGNLRSDDLTVYYDLTPPVPSIRSLSTNAQAQNILIEIDFGEITNGLIPQEVNLNHGSITNFSHNGDKYSFEVQTETTSPLNVSVSRNVATDVAGNPNSASSTFEYSPPVVTLSAPNGANSSPIEVGIAFSEEVFGFELDDVSLIGGIAKNLRNENGTYLIDVFPNQDGVLSVSLKAGVVQDNYGTGNQVHPEIFIYYDTQSPIATITSTESGITSKAVLPVEINFNEGIVDFHLDPIFCLALPSSCFTANSIKLSGGTLSNFNGREGKYNLDIELGALKTVELTIPSGSAIDFVGNKNVESTWQIENANGVVTSVEGEQELKFHYRISKTGNLEVIIGTPYRMAHFKILTLNGHYVTGFSASKKLSIVKRLDALPTGVYVLIAQIDAVTNITKFLIPQN